MKAPFLGILRAMKDGVVTRASLMPNGRAAAEAPCPAFSLTPYLVWSVPWERS